MSTPAYTETTLYFGTSLLRITDLSATETLDAPIVRQFQP
jgi:hypothetical protein